MIYISVKPGCTSDYRHDKGSNSTRGIIIHLIIVAKNLKQAVAGDMAVAKRNNKMPQYYPNEDVICWVKAFITEAYEGALDEEQKADLRKDYNELITSQHTETAVYEWAWNMIAVPFGIEDVFPKEFLTALYNSWIASADDDKHDPKQFSDELQDLFDEDEEDEEDPLSASKPNTA